MSVPRGPCPLHVLKDCWVQGIVDENTLVWGQVRVQTLNREAVSRVWGDVCVWWWEGGSVGMCVTKRQSCIIWCA